MRRAAAAALASLAFAAALARADNPAEVVELGRLDVVGTSPLPGLGAPLAGVAANVQALRAPTEREGFTPLATMLERMASGTALAFGQGNPFQPDLAYRGFVASPVLGQPQGVAVFQDGVRLNEPFGDTVHWDLLPAGAIGSAQLVPGSTPLFGPNSLGGTVALYTKSGAQWPGGSAQLQGGSFARKAFAVEQGGRRGAWDAFATADALDDGGWAAHNASRLRRAFAKVGYQTDTADLDVSVTAADNRLEGSQALPLSFLGDIRQPYTWPDRDANRMAMLAMKGSTFLAEGVLLGATAYGRRFRSENLSSNVNADPGVADPREATNDRSRVSQRGYGGGVQLTVARPVGELAGTFIAGATADRGDARYARDEQAARFTAAREALGTTPFAPQVDADAASGRYGVFVSASLAAGERWTLTAAGRHDVAQVRIADRSGDDPGIEGSHRFSRFNPGLGATYRAAAGVTLFAAYAESLRAPTPMELTCADPGAPCKLPTGFLSDPPLAAVVARTTELGARGRWGEAGTWSAAAWRTAAGDDIQFVSSAAGAANAGYFRNVGATRRDGFEAAIGTRREAVAFSARYTHVAATFRSAFLESSPNNASADTAGVILVTPGSRIPGIPADTLRLTLRLEPSAAWSAELTVSCSGGQRARGDENNRDPAGRVPGFAVAAANAQWRIAPGLELVAVVDNVFDTRYARSGLLGRNFFANDERTFDAQGARPEAFRGPGAPFGAWLALRWRWD